MNISVENKGEIVLARVDEIHIGAEIADEFKVRVQEALPETGGLLAVDLSKVDFMDSSGLGALVSLLKTVRPEGEIVLFGIRPSVQEILRLTHLDAVFRREADEAGAIVLLERAAASPDA